MMKSSMNQIETNEANDEPLASKGERSKGERSLSRLSPEHAGTCQARRAPLAPGQRWSVARKREVVLGLLRGESSELLSRELGLPIYKLELWRQKADAALEVALNTSPTPSDASSQDTPSTASMNSCHGHGRPSAEKPPRRDRVAGRRLLMVRRSDQFFGHTRTSRPKPR